MPSLGAGELIVIFVLVLVLFGPNRLPELARGLGKGMREVRKITSDFQSQLAAITDIDDEKDAKPSLPVAQEAPRLDQVRSADLQWTPHEDALPPETPQELTQDTQTTLAFDATPETPAFEAAPEDAPPQSPPPDAPRKDALDA